MKNIQQLLTYVFLIWNISAFGQCNVDSADHYNFNNLPATLSSGIDVILSGDNLGPNLLQDTTSCSWNQLGAIRLGPSNSAIFSFSQPVFNVSFATQHMNLGENGTVTTDNGTPYLSTDCDSDFTIIGNNFERTGGTELVNGIPLLVSIPNGANVVTITGNSIDGPGSAIWSIDLLDCIDNSVGIADYNFGNKLLVYPNPTEGDFSIDLGDNYESITITISDQYGKFIKSSAHIKSQVLNLRIEESAGVYFIYLETKTKMDVVRLIKK